MAQVLDWPWAVVYSGVGRPLEVFLALGTRDEVFLDT